MRVLLVGSGTVTAKLATALQQRGHMVAAQTPILIEEMITALGVEAAVLVPAEAQITGQQAAALAERGLHLVVVAPAGSALAAWAEGVQAPVFPYPPADAEIGDVIRALEQGASRDEREAALRYQRRLGGDWAARVQGMMAVRRIAVTSPKGGTGKTTVAANLAALLALAGVPVYAVDADVNAGALRHHLKVYSTRGTLLAAIARFREASAAGQNPIASLASAAPLVETFVPVEGLPTLRVLPGVGADKQGDPALNDDALAREAVRGLYDLAVQQGAVCIMDVGINPALPVHRWAIAQAEAVVIVLKAEVPDVDQAHVWLRNLVESVARALKDRNQALEFVAQRVKLVYNQVVDVKNVRLVHELLAQALKEHDVPAIPPIAAQIPLVNPELAAKAVNSADPRDILVRRYARTGEAELRPFVQALLGLAAQFVPVVLEGAARAGLAVGGGRRWKLPFLGG